jgi:hypothetical protein
VELVNGVGVPGYWCGKSRQSHSLPRSQRPRPAVPQDPYRAGQEDRLSLVLNVVVLFNTPLHQRGRQRAAPARCPVRDEDAARLSPLGYAYINILGRYSFPARNAEQRLRPLRDS